MDCLAARLRYLHLSVKALHRECLRRGRHINYDTVRDIVNGNEQRYLKETVEKVYSTVEELERKETV